MVMAGVSGKVLRRLGRVFWDRDNKAASGFLSLMTNNLRTCTCHIGQPLPIRKVEVHATLLSIQTLVHPRL